MSIIYFPNRVYKGRVPAIDRVMAKRQPLTTSGIQNIAATPLAVTFSSDDNWMVDSIGFAFSSAALKNFSAFITNGRHVVENLNDSMWIDVRGPGKQLITLEPGFYTGAQLGTELQTQLNTNAVYAAAGITFTVTYTAATGLFLITPISSTIAYIDKNTQTDFMSTDSISGHLFGLTATSAFAANITSDTAVFGLNSEVAIINETASTATTWYHNTLHVLTMDHAIRLASNSGPAIAINYYINYEVIV